MIRCYITDRHSIPGATASLLDCIARFLSEPPPGDEVNSAPPGNDVRWLQIREKDLGARELIDLVRAALALPNPYGAKILVNSRMDVARAAGADGLHLPAGSITPNRWRTE